MYSEGMYGEGGRNVIVNVVKEFKICVVNEIKVEEKYYKRIWDDFFKIFYVIIIFLFLKFYVINDVLKEFYEIIEVWFYIFIGFEVFGMCKDIIVKRLKLEGIIFLFL